MKNGVRFMKDEKLRNVAGESPSEGKAEKIDRRRFLSIAGKIVIPTLGIIGLTLVGQPQIVSADCSSTCASSCSLTCSSRCDDTCRGGCSDGCGTTCVRTCADDCGSSCSGGCAHVCGGCDGTCKGGCEGHMF